MNSPMMRAVLGFAAAVISVVAFHQGMVALLYAIGHLPRPPYSLAPVAPWGVPQLINYGFWAGLYGIAFGLILPRLPRWPGWLLGLGLGVLAAVVGWFVVAPLKGQPPASGFVPARMLLSLLINGAWGIGTGLLLAQLLRPRAAAY